VGLEEVEGEVEGGSEEEATAAGEATEAAASEEATAAAAGGKAVASCPKPAREDTT